MPPIDYRLEGSVAIVTMDRGENRFNPAFIEAWLDILDTVENDTDARALVMTSAHEKIFSNGMDLAWFQSVREKNEETAYKEFFRRLNRLTHRLVTYPLITIAAISGHAFALGAIMCGAFDFRFMRSERGYFCIPAINLGLPLMPGMLELLRKAVPRYKLEELILTGARLTAAQCETHHIVQKACSGDALMPTAVAFGKGMNKKRGVLAEMKKRWNKDILHAITVEDEPYIHAGFRGIDL